MPTPTDLLIEINQETRRLSTLLLGFAAAALAFGIHEIADWEPAWALAPAAGAGLAWSLSFIAGINWAHWQQRAMGTNAANMLLGSADSKRGEVIEKQKTEKARMKLWYACQLWALLAGAAFFVIAQGLHIANNAESVDPNRAHALARCRTLQRDMLSARPQREDSMELFKALDCHAQGSGRVQAQHSR